MLGRTPARRERFDPAALSSWAASMAGGAIERALFTNVLEPPPPCVEGWIKGLVDDGWRVFAKPKRAPADDIDDEMVDHLRRSPWRDVLVFSHDSACFAQPLVELASAGANVTVVGFHECAGRLPPLVGGAYVDAADVPGLYGTTPRGVRLEGLPAAGAWLERAAG